MNILTIDKNEFQRGITLDNEDESGGFSPDGEGVNHFLSKGFTLIPETDIIDTSIDTDNTIVGRCLDTSYSGKDAFLVDADKNFYLVDGTTLTKKITDTVRDYTYGITKMLMFKGDIFCTSKTDIAKLNSAMTSLVGNWWTSTLGKTALDPLYRHQIEVVEDTLYIADKEKIHTWDGTTGVYNAMSLPGIYSITEMIKSSDGRHLLVFAVENYTFSHNYRKTKSKLFIIDTVTLEFIRELKLTDQIDSAINSGGTIYLIYGTSFGYLTDSGIKLIRVLRNTSNIYGVNITESNNSLLISERDKILVYGDVNGKGNIFFYLKEFPYYVTSLLAIKNTGVDDNKLLAGYYDNPNNDHKLKILDLEARSSNNTIVYTKKYRKGHVWIRRIDIETETLESGDSLAITSVSIDGNNKTIGTMSYTIHGAIQTARFDCNHLVDFIQLKLEWARFAIKKITIYYESGE